MPYIKEENRRSLDQCLEHLVVCLKGNVVASPDNPHSNPYNLKITNEEFMSICGDINYCFSRVLAGLMGDISYSKIAIITGVLENIKQEFYRRAAASYEDKKIVENGDVPEYKKFN